jgi:hypothetical protein
MVASNIDNLIKDLWENRAVGIATVPLDFLDKQALAYLRERYPYLQMISMHAKFEELVIPQFKKAPASGWIIHDYGQAISSSPGRYLYGPGNPEIAEDDSGGGATGTGDGTLTRQTVDTAAAMIQLAMEKGWPGVEIISGTALMQWAAWLAAQDRNYPLVGYSPSVEEQKKFDRVRKERAQVSEAGVKPTQARGA